jgi:hypothetical protein
MWIYFSSRRSYKRRTKIDVLALYNFIPGLRCQHVERRMYLHCVIGTVIYVDDRIFSELVSWILAVAFQNYTDCGL